MELVDLLSARMWWLCRHLGCCDLKGKKIWNPDSGVEPALAEDWVVPELDDLGDSQRLLTEADGDRSKVAFEIVDEAC